MSKKWFPATKINIQAWEYFSIKMSFGDFFSESGDEKDDLISFAQELHVDNKFPSLLDSWMQRKISESRAKTEIASYLIERDDAFFSSVVIACLGEVPEWQPIAPKQEIIDELNIEINDDFGFVGFDTSQKYFVLDGQHRLFSIRHILNTHELLAKAGPEFRDQGMNVILVTKGEGEDEEAFEEKYRRLFTSLNRYAKSTNKETNIIMDEDDVFAIVTRKLIRELPMFNWFGDPLDNPHINLETKGLRKGTNYFTSLATLYDMNEVVLLNSNNINVLEGITSKKYKMNRPDEAIIEKLYENLKEIWNALVETFPIFEDLDARSKSRNPNAPLDSDGNDNLLLRPLGQLSVLAELTRSLIDSMDEEQTFLSAFEPLKKIPWDLRAMPFKDLLLINSDPDSEGSTYTISEGGKEHADRVKAAYAICLYLMDDDDWSERKLSSLKSQALPHLVLQNRTQKLEWWEQLLKLKEN